MTTELFANNTSATVSSGGTTAPVSGTTETWTVTSSASFPAASSGSGTQFHVADPAFPAEKIAVTNVAGTTWTVTRGAESTTPVAHNGGFTVVQVVTAGALGAFIQNLYQPWQFRPEDHGAKRDAAFLYDAAMTSGSAVLTTAGLPAPSAPTLSHAGTGGTVAAGTYQVKITYVNAHGETLASTSASTTTTGSTSTITVASPKPWTNATGWYAYVTQAGGSSYTRQQAVGSPTPLRTSLTLTAPPTSSGAQPPAGNTSNSAPFTSADVGKHVVIPSAGGFLNVPLSTTIASYQSASQVTLAVAAGSTVSGSGAVYGTDDTPAIQAAVNAAVAYAQGSDLPEAVAEVLLGSGYMVAGPLGGTYQNAQIQLPYVNPYAGPKVVLKLTGLPDSFGPVHWEQPNPPGATFISTYYSDTAATSPQPAVIGGPVQNSAQQVFFGGPAGLFSNMRVIVDGVSVLVPYRCSIAGLDLFGVGQADVKSFAYYSMARTLGAAAGGWPPYLVGTANPSPWQVYGYRTPTTGNNDHNALDRLTVYGPYYGVIFADHFTAGVVESIFTFAAAVAAPDTSASNSHHCTIASLSSEATSIPLYLPTDGTYTLTPTSLAVFIGSLHAEDADTIISDTSNGLYGEVRGEMLGLTGPFAGGKNNAANIRLIWDFQTLGPVASPPAIPGTGPFTYTNIFWRDAVVIVTGGTVSAIAIDGKTTGLISGPVPVRSGGTITLTYSAAPTWQWILK